MLTNDQASSGRIERLREYLAAENFDAILVRETSDIAWLTAFDGVFDEENAHALVVSSHEAILHTDSRYANACNLAAAGGEVTVDAQAKAHAAWAVEKLSAIDSPMRLAIQDSLTLREYRVLEEALATAPQQVELVETSEVIIDLRAVKDALELARIKAAQAITDAGFTHIIDFIKSGMTERQVQIELDGFMMRSGATDLAFPTIVATGAHAASPHAQPNDTVIAPGDAIVMDFGAKKDGYCSDMTRTVFVGEPSLKQRAGYEALRRANEGAEEFLKAGVTGKEAHELAEQALADTGFGGKMGHALGHGVGLDIHESPVLAPRSTEPLQAGNVVTVEPGIYLPGEFGMRLEDFGVITPSGYDVLTQSGHDMVII